MNTSRRDFLKHSLLATAGTMMVPRFLKAWENPIPTDSDKILIVLQLSGGNDGLNTVVPYRNDLYYKMRPTLALSPGNLLTISDELAFNSALEKLRLLYDEGYVTVINNVGYPNPDRSHFRSMDIWQTASGSNEYLGTGWIGRYLDSSCESCGPHTAIEIDDTLSLALRGAVVKGMAMKDPEKLYRAAHAPIFRSLTSKNFDYDEENVAYLYKTLAETISNTEYIYNRSKVYRTRVDYPDTNFSRQLKTIGSLIGAGVSTRVYYAALSGFDTHVRQSGTQERLLRTYADAVYALVKDLEATQQLDRVMIMTFSEFGRRVSENASGGTDHGTANDLFVIGKKLKKPGFTNREPNLTDLDNGDLIYQVDFRNVYASLLKHWLNADSEKILGARFSTLDIV